MKKNNLLFLSNFLKLVVMLSILLPNINRPLYAQTLSIDATPTLSPTAAHPNNNQLSSTLAILSLIISACAAFGTLLSGIAANRALKKSGLSLKDTISIAREVFPLLIQQAKDEKEKQRLVEKQNYFEQQLKDLDKLYAESKKAEKWLLDRRESLADAAAYYVLPSAPENQRKEFRSNINDYLYLIHNCLNIGEPSLIDDGMKDIEQALPKDHYKKALIEFVIEQKARNSNLSEKAIEAINHYTVYLIRNLN